MPWAPRSGILYFFAVQRSSESPATIERGHRMGRTTRSPGISTTKSGVGQPNAAFGLQIWRQYYYIASNMLRMYTHGQRSNSTIVFFVVSSPNANAACFLLSGKNFSQPACQDFMSLAKVVNIGEIRFGFRWQPSYRTSRLGLNQPLCHRTSHVTSGAMQGAKYLRWALKYLVMS